MSPREIGANACDVDVAPNHPVVRAEGLVKTFGGEGIEVRALRGVDLTLSRGQMIAIVGPSGSGKSTLMHIIGGIEPPTSGKVWLEDVDLTGLSEYERTVLRRRRLGFVFQSFNLVPMLNVLENVVLPLLLDGRPPSETRARAVETLERVQMAHRLTHTPAQLSGGEQQRVAIARALVIGPSLLLADEPTGNLDTKNGRHVTDLLRKMVDEQGQNVVIVTHDPRVARHADRVIQLVDGKIRYDGSPAEDDSWHEAPDGEDIP